MPLSASRLARAGAGAPPSRLRWSPPGTLCPQTAGLAMTDVDLRRSLLEVPGQLATADYLLLSVSICDLIDRGSLSVVPCACRGAETPRLHGLPPSPSPSRICVHPRSSAAGRESVERRSQLAWEHRCGAAPGADRHRFSRCQSKCMSHMHMRPGIASGRAGIGPQCEP